MLFADVILPVAVPNFYTYLIQQEFENQVFVGSRVVVNFGKNKVTTAIIARLHHDAPKVYQAKEIIGILDEEPSINQYQLKFYLWLAEYYMCYPGEVIQAALPSGLKVSSESFVQLNPYFDASQYEVFGKEKLLLDALKDKDVLSYQDIAKILDVKNSYQYIKKLMDKQAILLFKEVKEKFQPKIVRKIQFSSKYWKDESSLKYLIDSLEKKPLQQEAVLFYLQKMKQIEFSKEPISVSKSEFIKHNISESALKTLIKNNVFEEIQVVVNRIEYQTENDDVKFELSSFQEKAYQQIIEGFDNGKSVLLHGVTGSGKTEIYISLIQKVIEQGSQALFMLPEISITTQMIGRLKKIFGNRLGVYHSKYSDNERVEVWNGLKKGEILVVLGVRSSLFLPFSNLGIVIIDEEHEASYKQNDPAPRYNARDAAQVLAQYHGAKVVLGSATPSVESFFAAKSGKYHLVTLDKRFGEVQLPIIEMVDLKVEKKFNKLKLEVSSVLYDEIEKNLGQKKQTILFQNRRGYAPYINCEVCGFVPNCKSCNVNLTFHFAKKILSCHYCGHQEHFPNACPACGSTKMKPVGFGTERLEETIQSLFVDAKIQRMDLDTTRSKNGYQNIINDMENDNIDILVGTQMVTKGLDFGNVELVGVFDIDRMIHFPDFRSIEKVYQLLTQVSGRAGRKSGNGKVLIQTVQPHHKVFQYVIENNYSEFFEREILERERFMYPPFSRMIKIMIRDEDKEICDQGANFLVERLRKEIGGKRVLGPEPPSIDKIRDLFINEIYLKIEKEKVNLKMVKSIVNEQIAFTLALKEFSKTRIIVDVDPS